MGKTWFRADRRSAIVTHQWWSPPLVAGGELGADGSRVVLVTVQTFAIELPELNIRAPDPKTTKAISRAHSTRSWAFSAVKNRRNRDTCFPLRNRIPALFRWQYSKRLGAPKPYYYSVAANVKTVDIDSKQEQHEVRKPAGMGFQLSKEMICLG
jgi:hypothetical protein